MDEVVKNFLKDLFTEHPKEFGMTYFQHLKFSMKWSLRFFFLTFVSFIHAILPFVLTTTASDVVKDIHKDIEFKKTKRKVRAKGVQVK